MPHLLPLLARALLLRCPICGGGEAFRWWFSMRPVCPDCGFRLEREEGYYTGPMGFSLVGTELLVVGAVVAVMVATWPSPPWTLLWYGSVVAAVVVPLAWYPFMKTLWLAFDLRFRPPTEQDFVTAQRPESRAGRSASEHEAAGHEPVPTAVSQPHPDVTHG